MLDINTPHNDSNVKYIFLYIYNFSIIILQNINNFKIRQLTSSISAINEDDDYNYFIETTQNMPFPSRPPNPPRHSKKKFPMNFTEEYNNNSNNDNYISQLEQKVSNQSKKISKQKNINIFVRNL